MTRLDPDQWLPKALVEDEELRWRSDRRRCIASAGIVLAAFAGLLAYRAIGVLRHE